MKKDEIINQFFIKFMDNDFLYIAKKLLKENGFADEYAGCYFPDEFDEFLGVMFRYMDYEVTVSGLEFRAIIYRELMKFSRKCPGKRKEALTLIKTHGLGTS